MTNFLLLYIIYFNFIVTFSVHIDSLILYVAYVVCVYVCVCNNELLNYKVTIFILIRIEIKFWYKIINNF